MRNTLLATAVLGVLAGTTAAQSIVTVSSDITTSTTWTNDNQYSLTQQIYVQNGATLTIEEGTVIGSPTGVGGSLAVAKGSKIIAKGKEYAPIIFTSQADINTWTPLAGHPTGRDPKTGAWREAVNEWGNLTLMGCAYIGADSCVIPGNTKTPSASNQSDMEGLIVSAMFPGRNQYGGGDDQDDSGTLSYVSLRYGGRVIALNNELNGLSLGGIGRETDIDHIEIMNNVDDGTEIWGGCVSIKHFAFWNVGDDSLDIDQGWRGTAQFGLIVQGYSADASQGSGVGDNCIETDGAEQSDAQPVTTASIYNMTVIGQPGSGPIEGGDGATTWRDNARIQYRNCLFQDIGDELVRFDNVDGDPCGTGYGFNGTLTWAATWTTNWNATPAHANDPTTPLKNPQFSGKLAEITGSVFHNIVDTAEAVARGVLPGTVANDNIDSASPVVQALTRAGVVNKGGKAMQRVTFLDPRPANDALNAPATVAPWVPTGANPFKTPAVIESAPYRGAFAPNTNWLGQWTASYAYGFTPDSTWEDLGKSTTGTNGAPVLSGDIALNGTTPVTFTVDNCLPGALGYIFLDFWVPPAAANPACTDNRLNFTFGSLTLVPGSTLNVPVLANGSGVATLSLPFVPGFPGLSADFQYIGLDVGGPFGLSASNAITGTTAP
jgi:hypothetical protein